MFTAPPTSSRIEVHHDAGIIAALRASGPRGESSSISPVPAAAPARRSASTSARPVESRSARSPRPQRARAPASLAPESPKREVKPLTCPRCRAGTLLTGSRGWGCSRWREGCRFVVWFEVGGKKLTTTQLRELVTKGSTTKKVAGGEARLVLDVGGEHSVRIERR